MTHGCPFCGAEKAKKKVENRKEMLKKYGIEDIYRDGCGWWSNIKTMADIIARQEAWDCIGIFGNWVPSYLAWYDFTPKKARAMEKKDIIKLTGIGKLTADRIHGIEDIDLVEEEWQKRYIEAIPFATSVAKKNFTRVGKEIINEPYDRRM